ncbi:hypothetical protein Cni_G12750 [Canna indica]|uniref:DUF7731 domain-containing protein n=1 Tax=Canna indica TaxID=4628 RepID=A0AAQ3K8R4_9LILI|nr:hypothetical protein Cni_G12750 [Canna indica]
MGVHLNGTVAPANNNSVAGFCDPPCFDEMMLIADCVDGILSNFKFYNPGLMQGVKAIFEMSCSGSNRTSVAGGPGASTPAGGPKAASSKGIELALPVFTSNMQ